MPDDSLNPLNETVDQVAEGLTFWKNWRSTLAIKTARVYIKTMLAGTTKTTVAAAVAVSGAAGIGQAVSQEQARKPDDHLTSQSQETNAVHEARPDEGAGSAGSLTLVTATVSIPFEALQGVQSSARLA